MTTVYPAPVGPITFKKLLRAIALDANWEITNKGFALDGEPGDITHVLLRSRLDGTNCDLHYESAGADKDCQKLYQLKGIGVIPASPPDDNSAQP